MNEVLQPDETVDKLSGIIKPKIYSKQAIWGFSVFFTPLFGGILLMQNLKEIEKRKEANLVLILSLLMTIATITIVAIFNIQSRFTSFFLNFAGAAVLTEYFYKKYFPNEAEYERKKIWKPLIIGAVIIVLFILLLVLAQDQEIE